MATKKQSAQSAAPKRTSKVDPNETREGAFVRLAVKRVNKVINDIRLVGNLAAYPHTAEQAESIIDALTEAVQTLSVKIAPRTKSEKQSFTL